MLDFVCQPSVRHCAISWSPRLSWKQARDHHGFFLQPAYSQWYDRGSLNYPIFFGDQNKWYEVW